MKFNLPNLRLHDHDRSLGLVSEILLLLLIVGSTLYFDRQLYLIFTLPKIILIRIISSLLLLVIAAKIILTGKLSWKRSPLDILVLGYLLAFAAATFASHNILVSLLGNYERQEGLLTYLNYGLVYLFVASFSRSPERRGRICQAILWAGFVAAIYATCQKMEMDPFKWIGIFPWQRPSSTLGHPVFLGEFLSLALFLGLGIFFDRPINKLRSWLFLIPLGIIFNAMLYTQTRAVLVGFIFGLLLLALLSGREKIFAKKRSIAIVLLLFGLVAWSQFHHPENTVIRRVVSDVKMIAPQAVPVLSGEQPAPYLPFLLSKEETGKKFVIKGAARARLETWRALLPMIGDYSLLGSGPDAMADLYARYETALFHFFEAYLAKPNRAQNDVIEIASGRGYLGLLAYLVLLGGIIVYGVRLRGEGILATAILTALLVYFVQNQIGISSVTVNLTSWILLGLIAGMVRAKGDTVFFPQPVFQRILATLIIIVALLGIYFSSQAYRADFFFAQAVQQENMGMNEGAHFNYQRAISLSPYLSAYRLRQEAFMVNQYVASQDLRFVSAALPEIERSAKRFSYNKDVFYLLGKSYGSLGLFWQDQTLLARSLANYRICVDLDPFYAPAYQELAEIYRALGQNEAAAEAHLLGSEIRLKPPLEELD